MDNQSKHSKRALPNTPRVSDKIMEYYQKFGHDRDLEKFMRLYSPASSQDSEKSQSNKCDTNTIDSKRTKSRETISSTSSCEALAMMPSGPLNVCGAVNSKSLPNIDVQGKTNSGDECSVIVDINIETDAPKEKILTMSNENLETPKKVYKNITTQTPESVAKSHRRLEWDSLGDVGYKKSMSTSNISTIERSLLKEFFKENSVVSEPGTSGTQYEKKQHHKIEQHKIVKTVKPTEIEYSTPPLACSTLVEQAITKRGAKPKMITKSTSSTSLHQKFEKFAQTSLIKPPTFHSQEVQCCISSSNSIIEGTATPSSFEYYSSRSSSKSSDLLKEKLQEQQIKVFEHPFIASITDLLMKSKALGEKNHQKRHQLNNVRELQKKFQAALDENKENQTYSTIDSTTANTFSLSKQAPELDLGIQLICSLIDAKSVNRKQKKQLIRDIVKRLTRLEATEESSNSTLGTINSSSSNGHHHPSHLYDSVHSNGNINQKKENVAKLKVATELGVTPITMEQKSKGELPEKGNNGNDNNILAPKSNTIVKLLEISETPPQYEVPKDRGHCKQFQSKTKKLYENTLKENNTKVSSTIPKALISKETQSDLIMTRGNKDKHQKVFSDRKQMPGAINTKDIKMLEENKINRSTQTSRTATSNSSASATTTPDLTTQKYIPPEGKELNNSNTDAEQPTMREWLNPLTQSEIEYEEKKRMEMKKKVEAQREKQLKKSKHDCGRVQQLNWIENEIKRLECLKHLLLKDETAKTDSSLECSDANNKRLTKDSIQTDKLYDTVYSDKSSVLSESAERLVKEIEIILEESHEDIINVQDNLKRTKDRKKEIQILYEKPTDAENKNIKAKFRSLKESINISEEQLINESGSEISNKPRTQREKIDTPSTEKSLESESLRDLVQQRKREFMEAYKTKKHHHYEALKHQQKQNYKYLNIQNQFKENRTTTTTTESEHYSVPRTLSRKYIFSDKSYAHTQHHFSVKPQQKEDYWKTGNNVAINQQGNKAYEITKTTTNMNTNTPTTTSSSIFCISSELSTPISSTNLTSTNNTDNNQLYENKTSKAGITVAIQTTDSILRSKPIYGSKQASSSTLIHSTANNPVCIQVKPKGIAYVIEFNDNKSTSNTDINSNDVSQTKISDSTSNEVINNIKTSLSSKPQLTLQEHLERSKPKFLQQSKERKAILNQLQAMRQERDRQLREIIENTSFNSLDRRLNYLPPPPIQKVRILNTKAMKALTNKRFSSLPEVVAKQEREIEEKKRRSNRILRDVFNRRLQKRVRSGKLSLNHSKTVI
ncbi:uncharacterized protein ACRADG_006622 [Cochliomyia hominivorax]